MKQEMVIVLTAGENQSKFVLKVYNKAGQRSGKIFEYDGSSKKNEKKQLYQQSITSCKNEIFIISCKFLGCC